MAVTYTTAKIVASIRHYLDDAITPYLVSDTALYEALDDAQHEFAERTLCLPDSTNYTISVVAETKWYDLDERISVIRSGYLTTNATTVEPATAAELPGVTLAEDYGVSPANWRTATGTPQVMITDLEEGQIRLVPEPTSNDTLELSVYLNPEIITGASVEPTIPDRWRQHLVAGALSRLFMAQDTETYDPKAANTWFTKWEIALDRATGIIERNTRGPGVVRMSSNSVW